MHKLKQIFDSPKSMAKADEIIEDSHPFTYNNSSWIRNDPFEEEAKFSHDAPNVG